MPLTKEMFHRQSRKRTRVVPPNSKSQSECSDVDDASSVASFTSANDDNETYPRAVDNNVLWTLIYCIIGFALLKWLFTAGAC